MLQKIQDQLVFNSFIRFTLESYLELLFAAWMNFFLVFLPLTFQMKYDTFTNGFGAYFSILLGGFCICFPLIVILLSTIYSRKMEERIFDQKVSSFFSGISRNNLHRKLFNFYFCLRRLVFVGVLLHSTEYLSIQLLVYNIGIIIQIAYLLNFKPFQDSIQNNLELFNEICLLISFYHLFIFTD